MNVLARPLAMIIACLGPIAAPAATGWVERMVVEIPAPSRQDTPAGAVFRCAPEGPTAPGGEPDLPVLVRPLAGHAGYRATARVADTLCREETAVRVAPAPSLRRVYLADNRYETATAREANPAIYGRDGFWPTSLVQVDEAWMGTNRVARLVCHPLQWNPRTSQLRVYSRLHVDIVYEPESAEGRRDR